MWREATMSLFWLTESKKKKTKKERESIGVSPSCIHLYIYIFIYLLTLSLSLSLYETLDERDRFLNDVFVWRVSPWDWGVDGGRCSLDGAEAGDWSDGGRGRMDNSTESIAVFLFIET